MLVYCAVSRRSLKALAAHHPRISPSPFRSLKSIISARHIASSSRVYSEEKRSARDGIQDPDTAHEGSFSRTDNKVSFSYPEEHEIPRGPPMQGRGGHHLKQTLASFSLENRVGVVTGGARGLGLVMSQAMLLSGANIAIVDLNSM